MILERYLLSAVALMSLLLATPGLAADQDEGGFQSLFDGKTLEGWKAPDMSYWSVEEGAITGTITKEHPCTVKQYLVWQGGDLGDFELKITSRVTGSPGINCGFQFRSKLLPDHDIAGYQVDNNLNTDWLVRLYDEVERLRRCITTVADRLEHLGVSSTEVHIFKARFGLPRRTMREVMAWIDQAKQFEMAISAEFERRWAARQDDQKLHRRPRRRRPRNMASWHERNERFRMSSARHEPPHFSG